MTELTVNSAKEAILKRFKDNWSEDDALYTFDNEEFSEPKRDSSDNLVSWIRVTITPPISKQHTLGQVGNRIYQRKGFIIFQVFTPANTGSKKSDQLVQLLIDLFEGVSFNNVQCFDSTVTKGLPDGLWYSVAVQINFEYNETK